MSENQVHLDEEAQASLDNIGRIVQRLEEVLKGVVGFSLNASSAWSVRLASIVFEK
jgi:hypothetical protein